MAKRVRNNDFEYVLTTWLEGPLEQEFAAFARKYGLSRNDAAKQLLRVVLLNPPKCQTDQGIAHE